MQIDLRNMHFGAPAAERDINVGLAAYFYESEAFKRIVERKRTILLGNRGTGKSAIFKILSERARAAGELVLELNPETYSYEMLSTILKAESEGSWAKHGAFSSAWKYLILIKVMAALSKKGKRVKVGASARLYEYLRDHHANSQDNPISVLISYLKRIEGLKVGQYEASVKTRQLTSLYQLQELEPYYESIRDLLRTQRVIVIIDELDKGWDNSEDARAFVSGLFQSSISLNESFPNLTVYISLRQELYDSIPSLYDDAQKYRDLIETIKWNESSLLTVAARRIRHSFAELHALTDQDAWNVIFSETLAYRKSKSFNYLVDRTLYRPRELIQFCSDAVDEARSNHASPIDYSTISQIELEYSSARTKDIASEYRFQTPGLESIFEVFRGRVYLFDRSELENICMKICLGEIKTGQAAGWLQDQDPEYLINVLWNIGFLRAKAVGGLKAQRRSGSSYVGPHQVSTLNLESISSFQIHPMFRASLGMKEPKNESSA